MSRQEQLTLDIFFKSKHCATRMEVGRKKKCNLSLSKTPAKSPKLLSREQNVTDVITISDDEENREAGELNCSGYSSSSNSANSLDTTVVYNTENLHTSPGKSGSSRSPLSNRKFYSPNKKRSIKVRSPTKAKRNLNLSLGPDGIEDEEFTEVTEGLDDKTNFLVKIIYQYLNDKKLKYLMKENSTNLLEKCMQVEKPGMTIVCRLFWQKERWSRWAELKRYVFGNKTNFDDPTLQDALNSLIECGLVSVAQNPIGHKHELDFDEIVQILDRKELIAVCKELNIKVTSKSGAIEELKKFKCKKTNITNFLQCRNSNNENNVLKKLGAKLGKCYKLAGQARDTLNELYILIYLGMDRNLILNKEVELTLINEKSGRETYPIDEDALVDNASAVFNNRREFEQYLNACTMYEDFLDKTNSEEKCRIAEHVFRLFKDIDKEDMMNYITLPVWLRPYTPPHLYVRILEEGIIELKKDKTNLKLTVEILSALLSQGAFRQHKKANWFKEKSLILDKHLGDSEGAARVLIEGFTSNLPSEATDHLCRRASKLAFRKTKPVSDVIQVMLMVNARKETVVEKDIKAEHIYKVPMNTTGRGKIKFETWTCGEKTIREAEEQCVYEYVTVKSKYTHGFHWEGKIVITIYFLLFWDIIYASLRGVRGIFLSRYQKYPLDLFTECFYANRKLMIEERLREIEESTVEEMLANMQATWQNRPESELSGISRSIGWDNVRAVASCLGPKSAAVLCRRLATNYGYAHKGFPDLTLWNIHTKQITFVEVKTDSDKPSMEQLQWMDYMKENEIDTQFCYIGVHTMRDRSRNCMEDSDDDEL